MKDENKTKRQLNELVELRKQIYRLEELEIQRKQAEELVERLYHQNELILNAAGEGIFGLDIQGKHTFVNPTAAQMLGYTVNELIGRHSHTLWHYKKLDGSSYAVEDCPIYAAYKDGSVHHRDEEVFWRKDGTCFPVAYTSTPIIEDGNIVGAVVTFRDITKRKRAEKKIELNLRHLQDLLYLFSMSDSTEESILDYALETSVRSLQSEFAFIGMMSADEAVMTIHAWSKGAMEQCAIMETPVHFPIAEAGLWGEVVRQRRPLIVNDYNASSEYKKGYPKDHVPIKRFLGVPVFRADKIVAVAAVANKMSEYDESDVNALTSLLQGIWSLAERKRMEKSLQDTAHSLGERVKELNCLYGISNLASHKDITLEEMLQGVINLIPSAWQYPDITCARIVLEGQEFRTKNFQETAWRQTSTIIVHNKRAGMVEVCYLEKRPASDEGTFLKEERNLIDAIAERVGRITERKQAEEEIQELNSELKQKVLELTEANKELDAFNHTVSHDLKLPLIIIGGFARRFLKGNVNNLDTKDKDMLNAIQEHTQEMERLIKDLLAFSRVGRRKIKPTEIDIGNLVTTVLDELKPLSEGRMIKYDIKTLPSTHGDQTLIKQVFINLLSNAIKFTTNKKTAIIEVGGLTEEDENIYYVKDNGMGFNSQDSDKLFTVFQKLHGIEELEGSGVGLSIVQRIVKRHGGRVWAEGKVNEGASLYFSLPNKISGDS